MKCGLGTNKILTATNEPDHSVTTSEGRILHKKLASNPLKFQTSRRTNEQKRVVNRCRRCGKFSTGELCETHQHLGTGGQASNNNIADNEPSTSHTLPTMPMKKKRKYNCEASHDSNSINTSADKDSSDAEDNPEDT